MIQEERDSISILIVASIRLYREGLEKILSKKDAFTVAGTARVRCEAMTQSSKLKPDIVLLDFAMSQSLTTARELIAASRTVKIVALAVPNDVEAILACVEAGISGYVLRDGSINDLVTAIHNVNNDKLLCTPRVAGALARRVKNLATERTIDSPVPRLTSREMEIMQLIDQGLSNKQVANKLCIEVATVKNHVHHVLEKLNVKRRGEAAARIRNEFQGQQIPLRQ